MSTPIELEQKITAIISDLANELISLTPEFMNVIEFEIVSTSDGGADIGLIETHPEVKNVSLSPEVYQLCSKYLPWSKNLHMVGNVRGSR